MIYGASEDADWSSEKVQYEAYPSLGHTIDIEKVRNAYLSAKDNPAFFWVPEENMKLRVRREHVPYDV